jgi:hypothetical protein
LLVDICNNNNLASEMAKEDLKPVWDDRLLQPLLHDLRLAPSHSLLCFSLKL